MRRMKAALGAVTLSAIGITSSVGAQVASSRPRDSIAFAMEVQVRERWMHGRQQSRFTPFGGEPERFVIDSIRTDGSTRRLYLTIGRTAFGPDSAVVRFGPANRHPEIRLGLATFSRNIQYPPDSADFARSRRSQIGVHEGHLWDFVPSLPPAAPRIGLSWTDTIAYGAADVEYRRSLRGTRISRITRDTVVAGRRLWVVRDSANVRYEESYLEQERTLDTNVVISRSASGPIVGTQLLDLELPAFRSREDTTRLRGEATLRYPDGRVFRTPARYERMRSWRLYDAEAYASYVAQRRAVQQREYGGMVMVPTNDLERRLSTGDVAARDSLVREWQRTEDPDRAQDVIRLLSRWSRREDFEQSLDRMRLAAGDTAFLYQKLADRAYYRGPTDSVDVRAMLPFMEEPSIAWAFNLSRDWLYENLAQAMTEWPRAAANSNDDRVSCTVSACRMLAAQFRTAREPRVRDVALVALFSMDPRRWSDTVLARDVHQHPLLRSAQSLAQGVGARWIAASKAPLPPPNSDARAWLEWMNGIDPKYAAATAGQPFARRPGATPAFRFEPPHRTAIRMYSLRTGRDVVAELQRSYRSATSDSARYVFGAMLQRLGTLALTPDETAQAFASRVPARVELARSSLQYGSWQPAPTATTAVLIDRLIAAVVSSTPLWRPLMENERGSSRGNLPGIHGGSARIYVAADSVPDSLRAKWAGRVAFVSRSEWSRRDPREGGVFYTPSPIVAWGPFVRVTLNLAERVSRSADAAPEAYAAGTTYYLMQLDGEWVIIAQEGWIT